MAANQNSNSINLESANDVEQQQETFLRLTNEVSNKPVSPTISTGTLVSNDIFPSTLVSSSLSVGNSQRLPPGSAGFGTVEAVNLGSVNLQVGNSAFQSQQNFQPNQVGQNLNQNFQHNQGFNDIVVGQNLQVGNFQSQNLQHENQNFQQLQSQNFQQQQNQNFQQNFPQQDNPFQTQSLTDTLPTYGQTNVNIQTLPSLGPTFSPNDNLPQYGQPSQPQVFFPSTENTNNNNALPVYGQQFNTNNFQASSPLTANNQAWKGANHQQHLLNSANILNGQSQLTPNFPGGHSNERPVRFPEGASNRFDTYYSEENFDDQTYYDLPYNAYNQFNPSKASPNIIAELAKYSRKTNLIHKPKPNLYIQYPDSHEMEEPDKELILYPQGQLILNDYATTIGPRLRQYLQHGQAPHYVFARKKAKPSYEAETELFDPLLEGDEIIERSDDGEDTIRTTNSDKSEGGILPALIRTAKDDLKLVGDVIKMAFSR